jgi:hypothetical protein
MQIPLQICRYWYGRTYVPSAAFGIRNGKVRIPYFRIFGFGIRCQRKKIPLDHRYIKECNTADLARTFELR